MRKTREDEREANQWRDPVGIQHELILQFSHEIGTRHTKWAVIGLQKQI